MYVATMWRRLARVLPLLLLGGVAAAAGGISQFTPTPTSSVPDPQLQVQVDPSLRTGVIPGENPANESTRLADMESYWITRMTYPTGHYDGSWLLNAMQQDKRVASALPGGKTIYNRSESHSPFGLDPNSWVSLGPKPEQTDACFSCFNYGLVGGRVNDIVIDPVTPNVAYIATVDAGVWKTTNCCTSTTTWAPTTDDTTIPNVAIDSLVIDPNDHNTVYAGTGDLNFGSFSMGSTGILKTTSAGANWTVVGATVFTPTYGQPAGQYPQYQAVGKVRVDPASSNNVVAGTKNGLFFSYDAGANWSGPCTPDNFTSQRHDVTGLILQRRGSSTVIYTAIGTRGYATPVQYDLGNNGANGVYSTTLGTSGCPASWNLITTPTNGWPAGTGQGVGYGGAGIGNQVGRIDLAIAPSNPNVLYAQVQAITPQAGGCGNANGCQLGLWRTTDGGVTWTQQSTAAALFTCTSSTPGSGDYPQNWYDQGLAVDPNNPNTLFMDTYEVWKSTDGGVSFLNTSCGYSGGTTIHVDQHALAYVPRSSTTLLAGNDGGVYVTNDADAIPPTRPNYQQLNSSLSTIEFYAGDLTGNFATAPNPGANGGAQDNGSSVSVWANPSDVAAQQWQLRQGGDGFFARIEPVLGQRWYQGGNNGNVYMSSTGPYGPLTRVNPNNWTNDTRSFVTPYEIYKNDCPPTGCGHLIAGTYRVWEAINGGISTSSWYTNSVNLTKQTLGNRSYINQLSYAVSLSTTAIVGTNDGNVQYGFGLGQGTPLSATWVDVTGSNLVLPNRPILDVATDPLTPTVGYAAVGGFNENTPTTPGHVFQVTCVANCVTFVWLDKTGNLPNIPVDSIIANPRYRQQVFAGTDWGVYFTNNIDAVSPVWQRFDAGMRHTMVWDLSIDRGFTTLSAWTRGSGAFAWPLPAAPFVPPTSTPVPTASVTPTVQPTAPPCPLYTISTATAVAIISGTTDIGNHCDDCVTGVTLPFPVQLYDHTYSQGFVSSNGSLQFGGSSASASANCLPDRNYLYTIFAYQGDLCTTGCGPQSTCPTCGVFTTTTGTAPNRQYIIEWRTIYFTPPSAGATANFEVILTEGSPNVSVVYGTNTDQGAQTVAGIQQSGSGSYTQYSCNTASLPPGLQVNYLFQNCPVATATVTATGTPTAQPTVTATSTSIIPTVTLTVGLPSATVTTTALPPSATATRTATGTVTATATTCPIQFSDVTDPSSYYYTPVYYLACHGVVSGYSDGTFRPFNNTTRGQMAKIIILALNVPQVTPPANANRTFADVTSDNVFYTYIETVAAHQIASGYACGGVNPQTGVAELCDGNNRPYYRSANYVTRGQLTKIVSVAAGWALISPTSPSFSDVPSGSTFYEYVETAVCHSVLGGYSDGTFKPNNNAFRSQIAKIVYNVVTDSTPNGNCQPAPTVTPTP
jgi:hypothetical protein